MIIATIMVPDGEFDASDPLEASEDDPNLPIPQNTLAPWCVV
jgi:hypothetical protein